jgi:hypothetical protein
MNELTVPMWLVPPIRDALGRYTKGSGVRNPDSFVWGESNLRVSRELNPCGAIRRNGQPCRRAVKTGERCRSHSGPSKQVSRRRAADLLSRPHSEEYAARRAARARHEGEWKKGNAWFGSTLLPVCEDLRRHLENLTQLPLDAIAPAIQNWTAWQWQSLVKERRATRMSNGQKGEQAALLLFARELPKKIRDAGPRPVEL